MYNELIKALHEGAEFLECSTPGIKNSFAKMCHNAADAIEELSREIDIDNAAMTAMDAAMPRWIPVTERLPKLHDEEYLDEVTGEMVRYKVSDPILIWLAKGGFMDIGMYERSDAVDDFCYQGVPHTVTYWASLPKPPEEGET